MAILLIGTSIFILTGCRDKPDVGIPATDTADAKSSCWWCGDYTCRKAGGNDNVGDIRRICSPTAETTCPQKQSLGNGSEWALTGNCRCDG